MLPDEVGVGAGKSVVSGDGRTGKFAGRNFSWVVAYLEGGIYSLAISRPGDDSYWGFIIDEQELVGLRELIGAHLPHG